MFIITSGLLRTATTSLLSRMKITFSSYQRPRYRGRQDRAPMSHNSQDSIRAGLEVLPCSWLRRPQRLCRMHLPQHGLSLQIQRAPLGIRLSFFEPEKSSFAVTKTSDRGAQHGLRNL